MRNFDGLEVFVKVIQAASFSAAARLLGMPVTTISSKVAQLETRLGVTLIQRTTRKLKITEAGQVYFDHAVKALSEINAAERSLQVSKNEPDGTLRLTAPPDIGHTILPAIVSKYLDLYPKVKVDVMLTNLKVDLVAEGVDLAIRAGDLHDSSMLTQIFRETSLGLYGSSKYLEQNETLSYPQALQDHEFIRFSQFPVSLGLKKGDEQIQIKTTPRLISNDIEHIKVCVQREMGLALLPNLICADEVKTGKLVKIFPDWELKLGFENKGRISFIYPSQQFVPPKVIHFIELAKALA